MPRENGRCDQRIPEPPGTAGEQDPAHRPRRRPFLARPQWLLLTLFVGLQIADVITTNYALAIPGNWEANPLMALYQARLGAAWWVPKALAVAWICAAALWTRRRWPMVFAVSYYAVIVAGNLAVL
jgi:Domain of unknown function (DUF5658)